MKAVRPLIHFLHPYLRFAILAPLFMVLEVTLDLLQPRLVQRIVDEGISHGNLPLVWHTGLIMLLLAICGVGAGMGCTVFSVLAAQNFGADVRTALFGKIQTLSFGNLDHLQSGALITRLTSDVTQVQETVLMLLRVMVRVPLLLVGSLIMAIITAPKLALIFLPLIPFVLIVLLWVIRTTYPLFSTIQGKIDGLNTILQENLSGVRVVKAFVHEKPETQRFADQNSSLMQTNVAAARVGAVTMPLMMASLNAGVVAALWWGGLLVVRGSLEVGQVIAFVNYATQTLMALMMVSMLITRLSRAEASGARIAEVLDSMPQIRPAVTDVYVPARVHGEVRFENVCFAYETADDGETLALKDISFQAKPGQTIAIMGATGSGKSTLVSLIPRFYDATQGRVLIDGVDVRKWDEHALHSTIGIALQEAILFSGSIRDTIRYGRPEATESEVQAAARAAQADEFISRLPDGYDTLLGQRGVNLSGGQKQRLAIARALLVQPTILILDDSTSAVDVQTEARIQQALARGYANQTRIIVAQRISAVMGADLILVLDDGCLVAQGTHTELLESSPIYREIYQSQVESGLVAGVETR